MKWIALAIALAAILPLSNWLRAHQREMPKIWLFVGLSPFAINAFHLDMSIIDWRLWPGYAKGLQVSLLDIVALAILISLPRARYSVPFRFVAGLYFIAVVLSIFQAQLPMAAVFYAWQLVRLFVIYVIVARACSDERARMSILTGMAIGLCYEAVLAVWERVGHGVLQAGGSFSHQNFLGLVSEFVTFPLFALLLAGKRGWQTTIAPLAGVIIAVLTTSRATVGLYGLGLTLAFVVSSLRKWTTRKAAVLFVGIIAIALISPVALYSFEKRFAANPEGIEFDERALFNGAAAMILADHPFGIGANNYVVAANAGGYMTRAGVPWGGGQRDAIVHNAYWLAAAETGYLGVAALLLLIFRPMVSALRCGWQNRIDSRGDLLLGLGISLLVVSIHNNYEWIFFYSYTQYLFAMTLGLIAGLTEQLGYWRRAPSFNSTLKSLDQPKKADHTYLQSS